MGDLWSYRWNAQLFAASGYVVIMITFMALRVMGKSLLTRSTATGVALRLKI